MKNYAQKELTPVEYGISPIKVLEYSVPPNTQCFAAHWHERMEIIYIDSGELIATCAGREITAKSGDVVVFNCAQTHAGHSGECSLSYRVFMFELGGLSGIAPEINNFIEPLIKGRTVFESHIRDSSFKEIFDLISKEYNGGEYAYPLFLKSYIYVLLGKLFRGYIKKQINVTSGDSEIGDILDYIDENFASDITISGLSRRFGYTEAYFCRKFKNATGTSPAKYINLMRLEKAEKMLINTEFTCERIAELCGFKTSNYFSRCFKKFFGVSPSDRREL